MDNLNHINLISVPINKFGMNFKEFIHGEDFNATEVLSNQNIAIVSSDLYKNKDSISFPLNDSLQNLSIKGVTNDVSKELIIPFERFKKATRTLYINDMTYISTILSGEPANLKLALEDLSKFLTTKDSKSSVTAFDLIKEDRVIEARIFTQNSINLIILTILNSVILTSLWIGNRKFEIAIRKAMGASNQNILILYFKELFLLGLLSIILSIPIYKILSLGLDGYIFGFDISLSFSALIEAVFLIFTTSALISLPVLAYLKTLNINELLKGD